MEGLEHRRATIQQALPELERSASSPAASDDEKREYRSARASLQLTRAELRHLRGQYWIGVLEEFGILPNYTLLDDGVSLDVSVTWIDPETQEFRSEPASYRRSAVSALHEFAPGATFYARGLEIAIDAVSLGPDDSAVQAVAFCSACGYSVPVPGPGAVPLPSACPRCGNPGLAGREQHFDVVELSRVSAQVRRDEAAIGDRSDERIRERFTIAVAADIDSAHVARQWFVTGYDFGTKFLRQMDVRWINLGKAGVRGSTRWIAGAEEPAPLFRICEGCGVLDRSSRTNRPDEHRAWCRYRRAPEEHTRNVALTRTLSTQGAVIRLPVSVTLGDRFAVSSLAAALLLGLHEQIGGSPDHLAVTQISEPVGGRDGRTSEALLLHDVVPGGTGYLAELANPERVWDLLHRAWERVRSCPCQSEPRLACHRCLLPFAGYGQVDNVSRAVAERHLRAILTAGRPDMEPATEMDWPLTQESPEPPGPESHLEQKFRAVFTKRVEALGATVKESPGPRGNRLTITFPGATRQWILDPQESMGSSRPDFVLRSSQGGVPPVAIFTDGWQFHASPAHNRIADDAQKRQDLRDGNAIVLGITAKDVERAEAGTPVTPNWLNDAVVAHLLGESIPFSHRDVGMIRQGPLAYLLSWIQQPSTGGLRALADHLPYMFAPDAQHIWIEPSEDLATAAALCLTEPGWAGAIATAETNAWWWQRKSVGVLSRPLGEVIEFVVVLDDRESALEEDQHADAWREWLRISNALNLRDQPTVITTVTDVLGQPTPRPPRPAAAAGLSLPPEWQGIRDLALAGEELSFVEELARLASSNPSHPIAVPTVGYETGEGIPIDFAWPDQHVAVCLELDADEHQDLKSVGWHVFGGDPVAVIAALRGGA